MVKRLLLEDEVGAVTADWLTLSAGIIVLGLMVIFSIMNSAGYLMREFDDLNDRFAASEDVQPVASSGTAAASAAHGGPGPFSTSSGVALASGTSPTDETTAPNKPEAVSPAEPAPPVEAAAIISVPPGDSLENAASVAETASQTGQQQSNDQADPGDKIPR